MAVTAFTIALDGPGQGVKCQRRGSGDPKCDLARDFDDMAGRVQQLVETQQRLLRDVSHELRSPLARVQAAVGLLRQRGGESANLDRIERETDVLSELIGRVLGFSRLQARTTPDVERFDLVELLTGVVDDAAFEIAGRDLNLRYDAADPMFIVADPNLIRSAVDNVVRNAVQHSRSSVCVDVECDDATRTVRITIEDDGRGVADEDLPHLFEPFFSGKTDQAGAGVGLAIARRAIELHGGRIDARNAAGAGLRVTIELPASEKS